MIDQLTDLTNKTNELEELVLNLKSNQESETSQTNCQSFSRNFSNLEIILPKKLLIARIEPLKKGNILFQCYVDLTLTTTESVEISFIVGGFSINKCNKILSAGSNQITIMQNYDPLTLEKFSVHIEITPLSQKPININYVSLFVWGNLFGSKDLEYQALELENNYFLSMLDNNCVYYATVNKDTGTYNLTDYTFLDLALSYCFLYSENDDTIYFFRVDLNGNLFYSDISTSKEIFLETNVSHVSADISSTSHNILVTYVKNNQCFYFEINENKLISSHQRLYSNYVPISKSLCYYNKYSDKFILILTGSGENNYIIEQIKVDYLHNSEVVANYSFTATTNGSGL